MTTARRAATTGPARRPARVTTARARTTARATDRPPRSTAPPPTTRPRDARPPRRDDRRPRRDDRDRPPARGGSADLSASEAAEVAAARGSLAAERADLEAAEASPEALAAGKAILEQLMRHLGFDVRVEVETGETSRLNVVADGDEKEALGALIGRKGERLSALQHLVNLMLSKEMGAWTRVLVDVEDYRGRRERQLRELADRAAGARRRDRQDAPAGADARARAALDPPLAARPPGCRHAVDRRGAEPPRRPRPAEHRLKRVRNGRRGGIGEYAC